MIDHNIVGKCVVCPDLIRRRQKWTEEKIAINRWNGQLIKGITHKKCSAVAKQMYIWDLEAECNAAKRVIDLFTRKGGDDGNRGDYKQIH